MEVAAVEILVEVLGNLAFSRRSLRRMNVYTKEEWGS